MDVDGVVGGHGAVDMRRDLTSQLALVYTPRQVAEILAHIMTYSWSLK
jgi:hypothetical protein